MEESSSEIVSISANPGQTITLVIDIIDEYGERVSPDDFIPEVVGVYFPDKSYSAGFPQEMVEIETGLYIYDIMIPKGSNSIGTFIASARYRKYNSDKFSWKIYTINVARPFGNSSASPI